MSVTWFADLQEHAPEVVMFDGEDYKIICACGWECWDQPTDWQAWETYEDHVTEEVLVPEFRRLREATAIEQIGGASSVPHSQEGDET